MKKFLILTLLIGLLSALPGCSQAQPDSPPVRGKSITLYKTPT